MTVAQQILKAAAERKKAFSKFSTYHGATVGYYAMHIGRPEPSVRRTMRQLALQGSMERENRDSTWTFWKLADAKN